MDLHLYNTLTRKKEVFVPIDPPRVGLYTCGPTVYNYAHIGNLRTYLFEDILKRVLAYNGFEVRHVMNITPPTPGPFSRISNTSTSSTPISGARPPTLSRSRSP